MTKVENLRTDLWNYFALFRAALRPELPPIIRSLMARWSVLTVPVWWCCQCSWTTGGTTGMNCYHSWCMHIVPVFRSLPVTLRSIWWWERSALFPKMLTLKNCAHAGNRTLHHIRLRPRCAMHWRLLMIMLYIHYNVQLLDGKGCTTPRQWIASFRWDRVCCAITRRPLRGNWVPRGLDHNRSFVRPPAIPSAYRKDRTPPSFLFMWMI